MILKIFQFSSQILTMKKHLLLSTIALTLSFSALAQTGEADSIKIANIIHVIFDGMRESDTSKMAPYFHESAKMQSLIIDGKGNSLSQLNGYSGWLDAVEKNTGDVWNEQISNLAITSDGAVAIAWMDYKFYLGNNLSHCGINSFQFVKIAEKWKIIYIIDSRKSNDCTE
jgi:hypothetical protein